MTDDESIIRIVAGKELAETLDRVAQLMEIANDPNADPDERRRARKTLLFSQRYGKGRVSDPYDSDSSTDSN